MQHGCAGKTDLDAKCPTTSFTLQTMGACKTVENFVSPVTETSKYYEFKVDSSPIEWLGYCESGSCKACAEGETRCSTERNRNGDINLLNNPQTCSGGEWVSTVAFDRQEPALNVQSRALIAIAVMVSVCFLALLGVIAAVIMLM